MHTKNRCICRVLVFKRFLVLAFCGAAPRCQIYVLEKGQMVPTLLLEFYRSLLLSARYCIPFFRKLNYSRGGGGVEPCSYHPFTVDRA
jgi:hypothetical protein